MAKQPLVICPYCEKKFDRAEVEYVKIGRRYAHQTCADKQGQADIWKQKIKDKAKEKLGATYNYQKVDAQIKKMVSEGLELENIFYTLEYWYDIKQGSIEKANGGIAIVPYVYQEAVEYKNKQESIQKKIEDVKLSDYVLPSEKTVFVKRTPIRRPKRFKLFELH